MSTWLFPSVVSTLAATIILSAVYAYMYRIRRDRFMAIWAAAWFVYVIRYSADLAGVVFGDGYVLALTGQLAALLNGVLLLWGTFEFVERRMSRVVWPITVAIALWTAWALTGTLESSVASPYGAFVLATGPNFAFVGSAFIWTGVAWIRASKSGRVGQVLVGLLFVAWGLHKFDFPFVRQVEWLAPWGYLLTSALTLSVAFGIVLVYFRSALGEMQMSEDKYRGLFEGGHAPILVVDAETGDVLDANEAAVALYGYPRERLLAMNLRDIETMSEEDLVADLSRARERRKTAVFQHTHRLAGGELRQIEVHSGVQKIDGRDAIVGILLDVTEAMETRRALAEIEERYTALFDANRMITVVVDPVSLVIVQANPAAARFYGRSLEELEGLSLPELVQDDADAIRDQMVDSVARDAPAFESRHIRADGAVRDVEIQVSPMTLRGRTLLSLLLSDVTERNEAYTDLRRYRDNLEKIVEARTSELEKANRELVHVSRAKSQFLASMSHELRTPLNSIIGFTGILLQGLTGPLNDEQRRQIEMVNNSGRHLLDLINAVLDLSKIEAGRVSLQIAEFDANELVRGTIESLRPMAEERGLEVTFETDAPTALARTDEVRFRQIVLNLLGNAVKFTESGSVDVSVSVGEDALAVSIRDSGPGIRKEDLPHVFEEFRQLTPQSGEAKIPGTGLGLPVSVRLARLLGGSIEADSTVGVGSTFTITIPRLLEDTELEVDRGYLRTDEAARASRTVLLADDDPSIHDLFRIYLSSEGVRILHAYDLETALRLLRRQSVSVVVLDLEFEDASGWSLLRRIREDPGLGHPPVILCSVSDERERGRRLGAFSFLVKPVNREDLVREVCRALEAPEDER